MSPKHESKAGKHFILFHFHFFNIFSSIFNLSIKLQVMNVSGVKKENSKERGGDLRELRKS